MSFQPPPPPPSPGTQAEDDSSAPQGEAAPAMEMQVQVRPKRKKKKVYLKDEEKKTLLVKQCCFHFELYLAGKEIFYKEMQKAFEQKTGIDVNVKSFLQNRVPERRREVAKALGRTGAARQLGDFELALDRWIGLVDGAAEKAAAEKAAKKKEGERTVETHGVRAVAERACPDRPCEAAAQATASSGATTPSQATTSDIDSDLDSTAEALIQASGESGQKRKARSDSTPGSPSCAPLESKRQATERIMEGLKEESQAFLGAVEKMEEKKMNHLEQILAKYVSPSHDQGSGPASIPGRLDKLADRIERVEDALDKVLQILQERR